MIPDVYFTVRELSGTPKDRLYHLNGYINIYPEGYFIAREQSETPQDRLHNPNGYIKDISGGIFYCSGVVRDSEG